MKIASAWSTRSDEHHAANEAYTSLFEQLEGVPQLILVHSSCAYDNKRLLGHLNELAPGVPLQGGTSCLGVMTESGFHSEAKLGVGLLGILDPDGGYGVGVAESKGDAKSAVSKALKQALKNAGRPGELPAAVIVTGYPGNEEIVIDAIEGYFGSQVPIIGGTSADNDMSGQWQQFANEAVYQEAISIAVLFPTGTVTYAFHSGYEPTGHQGKVTRAQGRVLYEINGRSAGLVYREWTGALTDDVWPAGGSLVPAASFRPIGRAVGQIGGISYHRLSYPVELSADHSLQLFTNIEEGDEVVLMAGTPESLVTRPGRVVDVALEAADFGEDEVQGALVLFCTGCMLSVQDSLSEVVEGLRRSLGSAPFLGTFTLGEQGCFIGGENRHGNLMIAVLVFGPQKVI